ncbi:MAG: hypothetical protein ACYDCL_15765 [Myxococcales bacterium]
MCETKGTPILLVLALAGAAGGCNCGKSPCGGCDAGQACNAATQRCGPALEYGAVCLDDAGAPLPLPCPDGTSCQTATSPALCAGSCDPNAQPTTCPAPQLCWAVTDDAGLPVTNASGSQVGYCANLASPGQICGLVGLSFCDPGDGCVFFVNGAADGVCFTPCDPANPGCPAPSECLAVFSDPTQGICAIPQPADAGCVQAEGLFCPQGQLCLDPGDGGSCFPRCTPGDATGCAAPSSCLAPTTDPTIGICGQAQPPGAVCNPAAGLFCDAQSDCIVQADGGTICHQQCSPEQPSCPVGQSCQPLQGSSSYACG